MSDFFGSWSRKTPIQILESLRNVPQSYMEEPQDDVKLVCEVFVKLDHRVASSHTTVLWIHGTVIYRQRLPCHLEGLLQTQCKFFSQFSVAMTVLFRDTHLSDPVRLNLSNYKDTHIYFQSSFPARYMRINFEVTSAISLFLE